MLAVLAAISEAFVDILPAFSAIASEFNPSASEARVASTAIAVAFNEIWCVYTRLSDI